MKGNQKTETTSEMKILKLQLVESFVTIPTGNVTTTGNDNGVNVENRHVDSIERLADGSGDYLVTVSKDGRTEKHIVPRSNVRAAHVG